MIKTAINPNDPSFQENQAAMQSLLTDFNTQLAKIRLGGSEQAKERHRHA